MHDGPNQACVYGQGISKQTSHVSMSAKHVYCLAGLNRCWHRKALICVCEHGAHKQDAEMCTHCDPCNFRQLLSCRCRCYQIP